MNVYGSSVVLASVAKPSLSTILLSLLFVLNISPSPVSGSVTFDGREVLGAQQVFKSFSNVLPQRIDVSRNGHMATVLNQPSSGGTVRSLLQYSPNEGTKNYVVPTGQLISWVSWSNAGGAIYTYDNDQVTYLPWGQTPITVFNRPVANVGGPAINDAGWVAWASRDQASYPLRDEWLSRAGQTTELLPELNEYGLGNEFVIDNFGRIAGAFDFVDNTLRTRKLLRYAAQTGWEELLPGNIEQIVGIIGVQPVNARGDFVFASSQRTTNGVEYWLNLFDSNAGSARRLIQYNGDIQTVRAKVADTGDVLLTLRTPYDLSLFRYESDNSTLTDLSTILPSGYALTLQRLPQMNHSGEVVLGTSSQNGFSYFWLDREGRQLNQIPQLAGFELSEYALSDSSQLYFWMWRPNESLLAVVAVPEPPTILLEVIVVLSMVIWSFSRSIRYRTTLFYRREI